MFVRSTAIKILEKLPDKMFLKLKFLLKTKKRLNLHQPDTFCEKLQWLKLYDRNPEYQMMVDKYEVKRFVVERIGAEHVIPTYGIWNSAAEIDFDILPNEFVLKCTHDSSGILLCRDKTKLNQMEIRDQLASKMSENFYHHNREWVYRDLPARIFAEKLMVDPWSEKHAKAVHGGEGLIDYKFYCFHGEPAFLYVSYANIINGNKHDVMTYLTLDWQIAPFYREDHQQMFKLPPKPKKFEEMIEITKKLSNDIPFVRIDLYYINEQVYFSEMTFYPGGGFSPFKPYEWERKIGKLIHL